MGVMKPFNPKAGATIVIPLVTTPAAATPIAEDCEQFVFFNASATAVAFIRVTVTDAGQAPVDASGTADMPIPPGAQIRLSFGLGKKALSVDASAADGFLYVTPGMGD